MGSGHLECGALSDITRFAAARKELITVLWVDDVK